MRFAWISRNVHTGRHYDPNLSDIFFRELGMPEKINRKLTDAISDLLFVTEESGMRNLRAEGVPAERIFLVGNVMIDTLRRNLSRIEDGKAAERISEIPPTPPPSPDNRRTGTFLRTPAEPGRS